MNSHYRIKLPIIRFALGTLLFVMWAAGSMGQATAGQTAKDYMRKGDYANAILILNRAVEADASNLDLKKDLAMAYYMQGDYSRAASVIQPVVESRDNDPQSYQILGMVYEATENRRDAERTYRAGIKRFSKSGALYNELGELLWSYSAFTEAQTQWLKGIQRDPSYPGNYYNVSKFYYMSADKVWGLLYGEIFINLESYSRRTAEIKSILFDGYKKLFAETDIMKNQDVRNDFVKAYLETMKAHASVVSRGVTPDALTILRTRFLLTWFDKYASKFQFRLFDYQRQLARTGMFDAYNNWIFGAANNLTAFEQWSRLHAESYGRFTTFQKNRVFKVPAGQYYNSKP